MKKYDIEKEGQLDFFEDLGIDYKDGHTLIEHTDGVHNGNLLEFKTDISDVNKVLYQAIKYQSKLRITGNSVPKNILLIDLNKRYIYIYNSNDFVDEIHKVYIGSASINNQGFNSKGIRPIELDYSEMLGMERLKTFLREKEYLKIKIDEDCIVGWAERYYREIPTANKGDFIGDETGKIKIVGEIREPKHFKDFILPYDGKTNEKFKYLMDKLNDRLKKKDLGAFYTPVPYCQKAKELLEIAINKVPKDNDYIILDRCAGTGNLEAVLTNEQLSHCIVSTYEYYEYKVLMERLGDKVRHIIPPTESLAEYSNGYVLNADALSKEFIDNPIIKQYVDNENCSIILFENPPYRDDTSGMTKIKSKKSNSYVLEKMQEENVKKTNELANRFIWSGFKYYLRQPTDSYILFSPIKYWKLDELVNKKFNGGFVFNKKYFHAASPSAITCINWSNEDEVRDNIMLDAFDIVNDKLVFFKKVNVKKCKREISKLFDKRKFDTDIKSNIFCKTNGTTIIDLTKTGLTNENIIGYIVGRGFGLSNPNLNLNLLRHTFSDSHGFYLRNDTYIKYLPILCVKHHLMFCRDWTEIELVCCSSDRGTDYQEDEDFLNKCFFFVCLNYYNKCLSHTLENGSIIKNELCFDNNTIASEKLNSIELNAEELEIKSIFDNILQLARETENYNETYTYSPYQIELELNTYTKNDKNENVYDYPLLNSELNTLKSKLKEYYIKNIKNKMFEYELIK